MDPMEVLTVHRSPRPVHLIALSLPVQPRVELQQAQIQLRALLPLHLSVDMKQLWYHHSWKVLALLMDPDSKKFSLKPRLPVSQLLHTIA